MNGAMRVASRLWPVVAVVVLWELLTRYLEMLSFPPPSQIAASAYTMWLTGPAERLWLTDAALENIPASIGRLLTGWVLAGIAGIALGVALGRSPLLFRLVDPLVQFARAIPPPMLLGLFLALFAIGPRMQVNFIAFGIVWPVLINACDGARHVDRQHLDTASVFGLTGRERLFRIILPSAMPKIFAGLRVSLSLALILMVLSELIGQHRRDRLPAPGRPEVVRLPRRVGDHRGARRPGIRVQLRVPGGRATCPVLAPIRQADDLRTCRARNHGP